MANETFQTIIGTAIVNPRFHHTLLTKTAEAIGGFDLTPEESKAVSAIRADTIEGFAQELHRWITQRERNLVATS